MGFQLAVQQFVGDFIVLILICIHAVTHPAIVDHFTVHIAVLVVLFQDPFHGFPLVFFQDHIVHFHIVVLVISTTQYDSHIAVLGLGLDTDGMFGVVAETEIQGSPVDGGIHAQGKVIGGEHMLFPFDDMQVGIQGAVVQGGGYLADAAAQLIHGLTVGIGASLLVSLFCGPFAQNFVEGEGLAGLDNIVVDGLAGQDQVVGPGRIQIVNGIAGSQNILKQGVLQIFPGVLRFDIGQRQGNAVAGIGGFE